MPPARGSGDLPWRLHPSSPLSDGVQPQYPSPGPCPPFPSLAQDSPLLRRAHGAPRMSWPVQSLPTVHRLREGRFGKEQFLFPGRSRVESLAHPLPGPSAPVPCPSYRSPPPPHPEIARDNRRPRASWGGGGVRRRRAMVPFGRGSADRQVLVGQGNRPLGSHGPSGSVLPEPLYF